MDWHRYSGYALLGLVLFRIYWGLVGSSTARFSGFVKGPATMLRYLRGEYRHTIGHNPLGAWSVIALLLLVLVQVGLGLFAVDVDGIESGPLTYLVSFEAGRVLAERHAQVFVLLQIFVVVHVLAVFGYLIFKHTNLIQPMITGSTKVETYDSTSTTGAKLAPWWSVLIGFVIATAIVWYVASR
jgi:cytochrome b